MSAASAYTKVGSLRKQCFHGYYVKYDVSIEQENVKLSVIRRERVDILTKTRRAATLAEGQQSDLDNEVDDTSTVSPEWNESPRFAASRLGACKQDRYLKNNYKGFLKIDSILEGGLFF